MASTYLSRTFSSGNRKTYTFSSWLKLSKITTSDMMIFTSRDTGSTYYGQIQIGAGGNPYFQIIGTNLSLRTNQLFRDVSAWYHIVVAVDTTQATANNRIKLYINGSQVTSFSTETYPSQNADTDFNQAVQHSVGSLQPFGGNYFDGSMSHINFIDGTQYQASDFGQYDANGVWTIKTSPSVTYGTNGFFILKDGNSVTDQSGNGNNFTVAGGTLTNTEDSPSNVFATLNPLARNATSANNNTLSYGNNRQTTLSVAGAYTPSPSTLGMTSGKYYAEMKVTTLVSNCFVGIDGDASNTVRQGINMGYSPYGYCYAQWGGKYNNGTSVGGAGDTFGAGDIIGIAVDMDNLKVYFSKNGVWQNSGDPTSGSTGTGAFYTIASVDSTPDGAYFFEATNNDADGNSVWDWNFGNGYFGTTAVASAGTNASGNGIFEYDVPTGFTALSTKGLNL